MTELRQAIRRLLRAPGFTVAALLTLAVGLGATTMMFSIVNGILLQPLRYGNPDRLFLAHNVPPPNLATDGNWPVNGRQFHEWRAGCKACESVALLQGMELNLTGNGEPVRLPALQVSFNFFRTLGVQPRLGRDFLKEEELPGRSHELILSDALWRSRFGADTAIIGRSILIDGEAHIVVGIMPEWLQLPRGTEWGTAFGGAQDPPMLFRPLGQDVSQGPPVDAYSDVAVVRLRPNASASAAAAEMDALMAELSRGYPVRLKTGLTKLKDVVTARARTSLWMLLAAVAGVLLIICVNVGNLMLVRTASREREAGIRVAMGASRGALFRLVIAEAGLLVAAGGTVGLGLAQMGWRAFVSWAPVSLPRIAEVRMDWQALVVAGAAMAVSALLCGLLPAWRLARTQPQVTMKSGPAKTGGGLFRMREVLVAAEVALSTVLLVLSGLLLASFTRVMNVDLGVNVTRVFTQDISISGPGVDDRRRAQFYQEALRSVREVPGVVAAGTTSYLPLNGAMWVGGLFDPERPRPRGTLPPRANYRFVSSGYAAAMGIGIRQGRWLEDGDQDKNVVVISERVAQALWPGENPIGKHLFGTGRRQTSLQVIGVAQDVRSDLEKDAPATVYQPYWVFSTPFTTLAIRTQGDPAQVVRGVQAALRKLDASLPLRTPKTMVEILDETVASRRFQMQLAAGFGLAALLLAALGTYGVISFSVARRTPEIGIRLALGSPSARIVAMVVRQGMWPVAAGLAAGVAIAISMSRLIASQLFEVSPKDPVTIAIVAAVLGVSGLAACYIPARRAAHVDPLRALRFEQ